MDIALEARDLVKIYKSPWRRQHIVALDQLNLEVRTGEIFGLLGPNGSGKTTAMKAFLGLTELTRGTLRVLGRRPADVRVKSRIGFLPEESYFYKFLTARESLTTFGRLAGLNAAKVRERMDTVLEKVDLCHAKDRWVRNFSKGMLRRLGFAFILLKDPELIFLDEPTVGLDPVGTMQVREMMLDLKSKGKTIILSSHLLGEIENVCDRIAILYKGKILRQDTLNNVLEVPDRLQVIVKHSGEPDMDALKASIERDSAFQVEFVGRPRKSLERAFFETIQPSA